MTLPKDIHAQKSKRAVETSRADRQISSAYGQITGTVIKTPLGTDRRPNLAAHGYDKNEMSPENKGNENSGSVNLASGCGFKETGRFKESEKPSNPSHYNSTIQQS